MDKKILIISPMPYAPSKPSRSLESLFFNYPKLKLAQIYTSDIIPCKGQCNYFFRITDKDMLKRQFLFKKDFGKSFLDNQLADVDVNTADRDNSPLYKISNFIHGLKIFVRNCIWNKNKWFNDKLKDWIDAFEPQLIFLTLPESRYLIDMALYLARKYKLPIVTMIWDDYLLSRNKIKNRKMLVSFNELKNYSNHFLFVSDKMKDKYKSCFNCKGETINISTNYNIVNADMPKMLRKFCYFGNLYIGRLDTLLTFDECLSKYCSDYVIDIYSKVDKKISESLKDKKNIYFKSTVPYEIIQKLVTKYDAILVPEEFCKKKYINYSKYSLSTKVADSLASSKLIIALGNSNCGTIDFFLRNKCGIIATNEHDLNLLCENIAANKIEISSIIDNQKCIFQQKFTIQSTTEKFKYFISRI